MDLAISNGGDDTIYVYLGNGDGTFALPEVLFTRGNAPVWIAAAKLRTTGHIDLIAADADSGQVEVFTGNGDGTFQAGTIVASLNQTPTFLLTADFNRDGHADLAVGLIVGAFSSQPQFEVLLGDGTGSFPSSVTPPSIFNDGNPLPTDWMSSGDLNNDSYLDVVTTVAFGGAIAYRNQSGTVFKQGAVFNPSDGAVAVGLGDMDGDGCLDAIQTGTYGWLSLAKGNCDGTFTQNGPTAEIGDIAFAVAAADVNGDGKLDVVTSSAFTDAEILPGIGAYGGYLLSVLHGDGAGNVAPSALYRIGPDAYSFALTDLTGTGHPDVVTISETESTSSLLVNDGNGGFGPQPGEAIGYVGGVTNAPTPSGSAQTVDVNGDGKPDVVLIEFGKNATLPAQIAVLLNDGTGKLATPIRSPITNGSTTPYPLFVAGKFRSSSPADLIYIDQYFSNIVEFFPGNGDGTFGSPATLATLPYPFEVVSGDYNRDGKLDFAVFGYASVNSLASTELDVFLGNGDGTFNHLTPQTFPALSSEGPSQMFAGDFNHDGKLDLLVDNSGADLDLVVGNGDGTFQVPATLKTNFGRVSVADFNHDGYLDLLQPEDSNSITENALTAAGGPFSAAAFSVYLGRTGATFTKGNTYTLAGVLADVPLVGDFNGDGNLDVAVPFDAATIGRPWEARLQIFQGNGDGTFSPTGIPCQLPAYDHPVVGGDYRGLGVTDLLDLVGSTSSINTISAAPGPPLAIIPDSSPLTGSQGSATVTLGFPPTSTQTITLSASDPSVTPPGSITFNAGQTQQSFTFTIGAGFDSTHLLAITASLGGQSAVAYFAKSSPNLQPGVTALIGASTSGTASVGTSPGGSLPLLLTLQSTGGYSGTFGQFACSGLPANAQCTFAQPNVQLLPGGFAQVAFNLTTTTATPQGVYNMSVGASNSEMKPSVSLSLGVGSFSLSAVPTLIQINGASTPDTTVAASYTNGFPLDIQLSCIGLPTGASCYVPGILFPGSPSITVSLTASASTPALDYPFTLVGTAGNLSVDVSATLRVSSFSATVTPSSASVKDGQSVSATVELQSLNHFSNNSIQIICQSLANVTCSTASQDNSLSDGGTASIALQIVPRTKTATLSPQKLSALRFPALVACILVLFAPAKWRRNHSWIRPHVFIALVALASIAACGGGSGGSSSGGTGSGGGGGTGPQTLTVNVSAQTITGSGILQVSAGTITLTVN